jgi:aryl-alcohol dehydrogenase-like predicted oxidoreductase
MSTREGTWSYRDRFHESFGRTYFRRYAEGLVTSVGMGTYLGDPTDDVDDRYHEALVTGLEGGCNLIDTAVNYRCQRSERVVGRALETADVDREAVVVATKGGFVPFDGGRPEDPGRYVRAEYVDTGIVDPDDLVRGSHCIAPDFVEDSLDRSLSNLGLETIDLYYVHNPETALEAFDRETVYDRLEATFRRLEERAAAGDVGHYGVATWQCFRVPPDHPKYLSLPEVVSRASAAADAAGVPATHFRAVQLPFNVRMADAFTVQAHEGPEGKTSALWFANEAGLDVFTSASLAQGSLATDLPDEVAAKLDGDTTAQRAINFARSGPGVTAALVVASDPDHVAENVAAGTFDPLGADAFDAVFE